jgi:hypothetical protein
MRKIKVDARVGMAGGEDRRNGTESAHSFKVRAFHAHSAAKVPMYL